MKTVEKDLQEKLIKNCRTKGNGEKNREVFPNYRNKNRFKKTEVITNLFIKIYLSKSHKCLVS